MKGFIAIASWPYLGAMQEAADDHPNLEWLCAGRGATDAGIEIIMPFEKVLTKDEFEEVLSEAVGGSWLDVRGPFELCGCGDFLNETAGEDCEECQKWQKELEQKGEQL